MKKLIIGILVLLVGVPGFSLKFFHLVNLVAGLIPAGLIIGGLFAVYLGIGELRQPNDKKADSKPDLLPEPPTAEAFKAQFLAGGSPIPQIDKTDSPESAPKISPKSKPAKTESEKQAIVAVTPQKPSKNPADPNPSQKQEDTALSTREIQFKGNVETLVYHRVECNFATGKNCSMEFATKEEAESQGYKPCKICQSL